jgi:hypothetical protein
MDKDVALHLSILTDLGCFISADSAMLDFGCGKEQTGRHCHSAGTGMRGRSEMRLLQWDRTVGGRTMFTILNFLLATIIVILIDFAYYAGRSWLDNAGVYRSLRDSLARFSKKFMRLVFK